MLGRGLMELNLPILGLLLVSGDEVGSVVEEVYEP